MFLAVFISAIVVNYALNEIEDFQCRDQSGDPVDWFIFYKLPKIETVLNSNIKEGIAFLYMDSKSKNWKLSDKSIADKNQALSYTLEQNYRLLHETQVLSIYYNDEFPFPQEHVCSDVSGHTKGLIAFYEENGYWLIHSIPKFPRNDTYEYAFSARIYGQMGICVSLKSTAVQDIAIQLYYSWPNIYSINIPKIFGKDVPILYKLRNGEHAKGQPTNRTVSLTSTSGQNFMHFAKTAEFRRDLYADFVAPTLMSALAVETWQHGAKDGNLGPFCKSNHHRVLDIKSVKRPDGGVFSNYLDHSKYAITIDNGFNTVCVGDINRQVHQLKRAGGTLCLQDANVHRSYQNLIAELSKCPNNFLK